MKRKKKDKQDEELQADNAAQETAAAEDVVEQDETEQQKTPEEEIAELRDRLQRTAAELMNFRKQTEKRQRESRVFVRRDVFAQILPIVDNFDAAMKALEMGQDADNVIIGVKMIHEMLAKLLTDNGIKQIDAAQQPFDANLHEAVSSEETEDSEPNTVLSEVTRGYTMGDHVLRHSRVVVAMAPDADSAEEAAEDENRDD